MVDNKYSDQLSYEGEQVDLSIAAIEQKPALLVHTNEGRALGASWDAAIAAAVPPPPPKPRVLIGTTSGSAGIAMSVSALPGCQVDRSFQSGLPTKVSGDSDLIFCKAHSLEVWYVFGVMPSQNTFKIVVADWIASGLSFWWTYQNEVDASGLGQANFRREYDQLQAWAEEVPGYKESKVRDQTCFQAYMLTPPRPHGDPDLWVPTRPTRLGINCYRLAQVPMMDAFAARHNLPYVVPEFGCGGVGGELPPGWTQSQYNSDRDGGARVWAKAFVESTDAVGLSWYSSSQGGNARSESLTRLPKTAAFLGSLIAK